MPSWRYVVEAEPEFAGRVRALFEAGRHKTIATLRADGSPRISGIECEFTDDGELQFGSMTGARKGIDLHRDPRFALHGPTFHPVEGQNNSETAVEYVDERTTKITNRRNGQVTQVIMNRLTENGDTIHNEYIRIAEDGTESSTTAIYDRVMRDPSQFVGTWELVSLEAWSGSTRTICPLLDAAGDSMCIPRSTATGGVTRKTWSLPLLKSTT